MRRLFTVTRQGKPVAVVLAGDFAEAVRLAAPLDPPAPRWASDAPAPRWAHDAPAPISYDALRARRPAEDERLRFAAVASRFAGEARLAVLAL